MGLMGPHWHDRRDALADSAKQVADRSMLDAGRSQWSNEDLLAAIRHLERQRTKEVNHAG